MRRRRFLLTAGAGAAAVGSGCLGSGGEVVVSVAESIRVEAGDGWVKEIPDVSDTGGAVSYTVKSEDGAFGVYFFVGREQHDYYNAFVRGNEPAETPAGDSSLSKAAVPQSESEDVYQAATKNDGARESLDTTGPYYFVVDHSSYRLENRVEEHDAPLSAFVDLEVVQQRSIF